MLRNLVWLGPTGSTKTSARVTAPRKTFTPCQGRALEVVIDYADTDSALRVSKHFDFEPGSHTIGVHYTITNREPKRLS